MLWAGGAYWYQMQGNQWVHVLLPVRLQTIIWINANSFSIQLLDDTSVKFKSIYKNIPCRKYALNNFGDEVFLD